ncbi:hypothetical protein [Microtetraspora sp. NBRC 16547]|uniref:hypothetical protein n=1 Tax=Microtetraspora sp. NBRC 16547 TaxID=3030993 RepID=UPI00249FFB54|nr:hypothetical protein [Microtetraspora sp. NBRC 16547]GLX01519.1 hypothetical protein Misp02_56050 [Microtetraspora sp. NBRC 16547]
MPDRQTFDASALLDLLERSWGAQLRRVSLVIEAEVTEETIEAAADALGTAYRRLGHQELATRWPACVAVSLAGIAARHDPDSPFWPHWWAATHHRGSPSRWGAAFLNALRAFGLPADRDAKQSIMTHAGFGTSASGDTGEAPPLHLDPFGQGVQRAGAPLPRPTEETLLVFAEDGRHLSAELPPRPVWVVHPRDREPTADVPLRTLAESLLPLEWEGWRLAQVDLGNAAWLALTDGPRHTVRKRSRPRLSACRPVPGVTTPDGSAVLASPPALWLPKGDWTVTVERAGTHPAGPADHADLWAGLPRPLLGTFIVTARTPGGRVTRETVTVAEGLAVRYEPPVRLFDDEGLMPSDVSFAAEPGLTVTPQALAFASREQLRRITCVASGQVTELIITPPRMRVRTGGEWHTAPLHLTRAAVEELETLRLDIPGIRERLPIEVVAEPADESSSDAATESGRTGSGETVQVLTPHARGDYPLRRVLDTLDASLDAHQNIALMVRVGGHTVPLAFISPGERHVPDPWLCND